MSCPKWPHCHGTGSGGSGPAGLAGAIVLIVIGAAIWHALTAPSTARAIGTGLAIVAVIVGSAVGLAIVAVIVAAGLAIRRRLAARSEPRPALVWRAEPARLPEPASERPALRVIRTRALPAPGPRPEPAPYGSERPAGARKRPRRG